MTPHSRMEYLFFAQTDCGRVRKNNEDAVATAPEIGLALLADGMGGYNAGEVASNMAISITEHAMARWFAHAGTTPTTSDVRKALFEGRSAAKITESWKAEREKFQAESRKYYLYE